MTSGTYIHAYGIVPAEAVEETHVTGLGDAPVFYVVAGPVAAVVSQVDTARFGPEQWEAHAEDPAWLGEVAARHDAVLQAVAEVTDVLPLRLPALYDDFAELERTLRADSDRYVSGLLAVRDHLEWAVKVFVVPNEEAPPIPQPATGRDYLLGKSRAASAQEDAARARHSIVLDVHEALALSSTHATVNPPQDRALSGRKHPMLLNAAYLVPRAARESFLGLCEQLAEHIYEHALVLEVSGPWPAYNFVGLSQERGVPSDLSGGAP